MSHAEAFAKLFEFAGALSVAVGAMAWFRRESDEDDALVVQAHDVVLGALSDADSVRTIEAITDRNLRDQVTVEQAESMNEERQLRRMENRN